VLQLHLDMVGVGFIVFSSVSDAGAVAWNVTAQAVIRFSLFFRLMAMFFLLTAMAENLSRWNHARTHVYLHSFCTAYQFMRGESSRRCLISLLL